MSAKSTPLNITGKKCSLPSFLSLSDDEDVQKFDYVMRATCAFSIKSSKPYMSILIVPTKEDIKTLYDKIVDDASLKGDNYQEVTEITSNLFFDQSLKDYESAKDVNTLEDAFENEDIKKIFPGLTKKGEFSHEINGKKVKCIFTGISIYKFSPLKTVKPTLGGFIACAQESMLSSKGVSGGRVELSCDSTPLTADCESNTTKLSAILSIHSILHNSGKTGNINNAILCYNNSIWLQLYKQDNDTFNRAIAYRDPHPFVDLVMQFTHYSPLLVEKKQCVVSHADYVEVDEYEVYNKLNSLTFSAAKSITDSKQIPPEYYPAINIRKTLRNAWVTKEGNVHELMKIIHAVFVPQELKQGGDEFLETFHQLANCEELKDEECRYLYIRGGIDKFEKNESIAAETICEFLKS